MRIYTNFLVNITSGYIILAKQLRESKQQNHEREEESKG
jgi:hypothetical protein